MTTNQVSGEVVTDLYFNGEVQIGWIYVDGDIYHVNDVEWVKDGDAEEALEHILMEGDRIEALEQDKAFMQHWERKGEFS